MEDSTILEKTTTYCISGARDLTRNRTIDLDKTRRAGDIPLSINKLDGFFQSGVGGDLLRQHEPA